MKLQTEVLKKQNHKLFLLIYKYSALELRRNMIGILLLFLIPVLFLSTAYLTASYESLPVKLFFFDKTEAIILTQKKISLVFMGAAVAGFLSAFYASTLFYNDRLYFKYCASMGMEPIRFAVSRFSFFVTLAVFLTLFISFILGGILTVNQPLNMFFGFLLLEIIYGAYGGIAGLLSKDYLVALLLILLLVNFDAGWLQNPVFYTNAQSIEIIRWLPAFYPCQLLFTSIFTEQTNAYSYLFGGIYTAVFVSILFIIIFLNMKSVYRKINGV